jgi:hypothetical protein
MHDVIDEIVEREYAYGFHADLDTELAPKGPEGVPFPQARAMLIEAFVREITDSISPTSLRDHLNDVVASRLGAGS